MDSGLDGGATTGFSGSSGEFDAPVSVNVLAPGLKLKEAAVGFNFGG